MLHSVHMLFITMLIGLTAAIADAAAPLADRVPGDAVFYLGWAGTDSQADAYNKSDLKAFIEHSNLQQVADQFLPKLWNQISDNSDDPQTTGIWQKTLPVLCRHPLAIYLSNVTIITDGTPDAQAMLICDAGSDAAELQSDFQSLLKGNSHLTVEMQGSLLTVGHKAAGQAGTAMLAADPRFMSSMAKLQSAPALAAYVDVKTILQKVDESTSKDPNAAPVWPKARDVLGLNGCQTCAMTAGFDGGQWMTHAQMDAPSPRTGLLAVIEPKPIDPALLARIPASADSVSMCNFDLPRLYDTIAKAMAVTPVSDDGFHKVSGLATVVLGGNLRRQILGPLGSQWVMYADSTPYGPILLNHPSDSATTSDAMVSAAFGVANIANSTIPGAATQPVVTAEQASLKKVDYTSLTSKYASLSFAVKNGIFYVGTKPEGVVTSATIPAVTPLNNLFQTEHFASAEKRLGVTNFCGFNFCDLPITAPKAYENFQGSRAHLRQMMESLGVEMPDIQLPPLDDLKSHLSPALAVSWADDSGLYFKSSDPFPLCNWLLGDPQQMMISSSEIEAFVELIKPALVRARDAANRVKMSSNERRISLACIMYASGHQGSLPTDPGAAFESSDIDAKQISIFLLPDSQTQVPAEILSGTREQQADWVTNHTDFILLNAGKPLNQIPNASETALIVPKNAEQSLSKVAVGFADGHVEICPPARIKTLLHPEQQGN